MKPRDHHTITGKPGKTVKKPQAGESPDISHDLPDNAETPAEMMENELMLPWLLDIDHKGMKSLPWNMNYKEHI